MSNVNVIKKTVEFEGRLLDAMLVQLKDANGEFGEEGMIQPRFAELIGTSNTNVGLRVSNKNLHRTTLSRSVTLSQLKGLHIVGHATGKVNFLPKATIRELVRIIDTPQAKAIYNQLWDDAEDNVTNKALVTELQSALVHERATVDAMVEAAIAESPPPPVFQPTVEPSGRLSFTTDFFYALAKHQQDQEDLLAAERARAETEKLRADNAEREFKKSSNLISFVNRKLEAKEAELQDRQEFAVQYALAETLTAKGIFDNYGGIRRYAMKLKTKQRHLAFAKDFNDAGWVSHYLRTTHKLYARIQEIMPEYARYLYNKADIEAKESVCQSWILAEVEEAKNGSVPTGSQLLRDMYTKFNLPTE